MRYIGITTNGTVLIEMSVDEWNRVGQTLPTVELLGEQVRAHRAIWRITQTEMAERAGISRNYLSLIESGKIANISLGILSSLQDAMALP